MPRYPVLFFGTGNAHKLEEVGAILSKDTRLLSFRDLPIPLEVEETESTLEGNAILKAKAFFAETGIPSFSDDTGLEVEALDGRPGVFSARFAGPNGDAQANMAKLLQELQGITNRKARFRTVIAFFDGKSLQTFEGILPGTISEAPTGTQGFGYDPIFVPEGGTRSLAELSPVEKNAISHRARALALMQPALQ